MLGCRSRATTRPCAGRRQVRVIRHAWLTDQIRDVHAGREAPWRPSVHAELTLGRGLAVVSRHH